MQQETVTLIIETHQFQHYYSPELEQNPEMEVKFDTKYSIRSCLTMVGEGQSKRCTCQKFLLIRPRPNQVQYTRLEQELEKRLPQEPGEES